ncbi:BAG family molecular chaperone regulator 8, chloroplastic-like protein [Drosera capensis]
MVSTAEAFTQRRESTSKSKFIQPLPFSPAAPPMAYHHHHHHSSPCSPPPPSYPPPPQSCPYLCPHQPPPCHHHSPPPPPDLLLPHLFQNPNPNPNTTHFPSHHQKWNLHSPLETHYPLLFQSLIHRIETLESTLNHHHLSDYSSSYSGRLRDVAALTIQFYFRRFLVRRSIAFRQLKELAKIKARLASLESSLRRSGGVDFGVVSRNAMDLLIWVDCIRAGDGMIRDSKRSITREIVRILEFVDGLNVERFERDRLTKMKVTKSARIVRSGNRARMPSFVRDNEKLSKKNAVIRNGDSGRGRDRPVEELRERVERIRRLSKELEEEDGEDVEFYGFKHVIAQDGGGVDGVRNVAFEGHDSSNCRDRPVEELRERVERIRRLSRELEDDENVEFNGFKHVIAQHGGDEVERTDAQNYKDGVPVSSRDSFCPNRKKRATFLDDDEIKVVHSLSAESVEEEGESEGSSEVSDHDGGNTKRDLAVQSSNEDGKSGQKHNEELVFSAPLPVKMESRAELMKNRKNQGVKITD